MITSLFFSCKGNTPQTEEFVGLWVASDGASLTLRDDNTFEMNNFDEHYWEPNKESHIIDGIGEWNIKEKSNGYLLELTFTKYDGKTPTVYCSDLDEYHPVKSKFPLEIKGEGFFSNKRPWHLYISEYGEDGGDECAFYKSED